MTNRQAYQKQRREAHRAEMLQYLKAYYADHKQDHALAARRNYIENAEKVKAKMRAKYLENREAVKARATSWNRANPERRREIYCASSKLHRETSRAAWHRRRARLKGAGGSYQPADIQALYAAQSGLCASCREALKGKYEVDHIMPLRLGGSNWPDNLQLLCRTCNRKKGHKHPEKWNAA